MASSSGPGNPGLRTSASFDSDHAADWIVISAINSTQRPGFVECVATLGGDRSSRNERRYLVPSGEYEIGPFGFVIDPHASRRLRRPERLSSAGAASIPSAERHR